MTMNSVLGKGTANYEEADVLFLTEEEARVEMLRDPHIYWKPIVVCAAPKEGQHTIETFFDYLDTWSEQRACKRKVRKAQRKSGL